MLYIPTSKNGLYSQADHYFLIEEFHKIWALIRVTRGHLGESDWSNRESISIRQQAPWLKGRISNIWLCLLRFQEKGGVRIEGLRLSCRKEVHCRWDETRTEQRVLLSPWLAGFIQKTHRELVSSFRWSTAQWIHAWMCLCVYEQTKHIYTPTHESARKTSSVKLTNSIEKQISATFSFCAILN